MNFTENLTSTLPLHATCDAQLSDILPLALTQTLSFVANAISAFAIWRLPGLEENKNHLIIRTLVVSDLLIPLPMLPFSIASYSNCGWIGGKIACTLTAFLSTAFLSWSVFIVFVMCILRYLAVTKPLWYRNQVTYTRVQVALFVAFLWACLHLILPTAGLGKFRLYEKGYYCALDLTPEKKQDRVLVYLVITEGILSTAALLYSCVVIISSLVKRRRRVSEQLSVQHRGGGLQQVKRQHGGFAGLTLVIVILFCVCYVPFLVSAFNYLAYDSNSSSSSPVFTWDV